MNRNIAAKNKPSYKVYGFWSIIVLLTLVFVAFVIVKFVSSRSDLDLDDLSNLTGQQVLEREGTYYVFIYSKVGITEDKTELERTEELRKTIENYLNRADKNKELPKLYGMIVENGYGDNDLTLFTGEEGTQLEGKTNFRDFRINKADVPMLIKVSNKRVSAQYLKEIDIKRVLEPEPNQ